MADDTVVTGEMVERAVAYLHNHWIAEHMTDDQMRRLVWDVLPVALDCHDEGIAPQL
jgi:hypothetical protein